MRTEPVLLTGSTGYVGGRLAPKLLEAGYRVRALGRSLAKLKGRSWAGHPNVELAAGDVLDLDSLRRAAQGCWAGFYLVHSMLADPQSYSQIDRQGAQNMVAAAAGAGLDRIIYLGGLGRADDPNLSEHLRSRTEVAHILQSGPAPATFLRAAMVLGSGSASFEIMRYLVDRLPVMITPRWVYTPVQPIAVSNVLGYLQGCLEHDEVKGQTFDIGGPDVVSYRQLFDIYAEEAGLRKRLIIPVPVLTPKLSSYWIHLVTPVPAGIAQPLANGLRNPVVCQDQRIREIIPQQLLTCRETIRLALDRIEQQRVDTCWMDAGRAAPPEWLYCGDADYSGGAVLECGFRVFVDGPPEEVWPAIAGIGGATGWYFGDRLWKLRGWVDRLLGGVGYRAGRRHPTELQVGDALDFWRVLEVAPPRRLLLLAEMKLPGEAVLEFSLDPVAHGGTELRQIARFLPRGLAGLTYWYALAPFHRWIYAGMLKAMARATGKAVVSGPEPYASRKRPPGRRR
ncbi:MAG: SDR family oxidoreductase [Deltaproteobacteria bacterium]|nr:SDR family oxidoreductase [Deltaproteobacteria bacterium]